MAATATTTKFTLRETVNRLVKPTTPTNHANIPLSLIDRAIPAMGVPIMLIYKETQDCDLLRASLAHVLQRFPIFAGGVAENSETPRSAPVITCDDRGIPFAEATTDATLEDLGGPDFGAEFSVTRFADALALPFCDRLNVATYVNEPVMKVKVTHLKNGGSVIGVVVYHCIVDASALIYFLNEWAACARAHDFEATLTTADLDRSRIQQLAHKKQGEEAKEKAKEVYRVLTPEDLGKMYAEMMPQMAGAQIEVVCFEEEELKRMKDAASDDLGSGFISTNDALCAHIWQVVFNLRDVQADTGVIGMAANIRPRVDPPIPADYIGNAVSFAVVELDIALIRQGALGAVARAIRAQVNRINADFMQQTVSWLQDQDDAGIPFSSMNANWQQHRNALTITSWAAYPSYAVDFNGGGGPAWVYVPTGVAVPGLLFLLPLPGNKKGLCAYIHLTAEQHAALQQPQHMHQLRRYK